MLLSLRSLLSVIATVLHQFVHNFLNIFLLQFYLVCHFSVNVPSPLFPQMSDVCFIFFLQTIIKINGQLI